ncbi:hypothetical protein ACFCYH_38085 [Streptomyces sp. NPDC056400]|uniref:hypothetical protein n=1 Tax=unclassified Streptomyces TaxID=2593676 RepID=UPI0035DD1B8A
MRAAGFSPAALAASRARRRSAASVGVKCSKEAAVELAAHLYYDDCLGLERKKAKAAELRGWVRPADMRVAPPRRRWTPKDDETLLRLNDPAAAGVALNRTEQSCSMRLWRLRTGKA